MKRKILVLSYFYPPCSLTASQRALGYVTYLEKHDIYPIVVSKHWDAITANESEIAGLSDKPYIVEQNLNHEIHFTPYKKNFRDSLLGKSNILFVVLRKILSLVELILQNFSISVLSYSPMYDEARKLLIAQPDIKDVLIIASPYQLFHMGYRLKKEFPHIHWYADYRDDWNTKELIQPNNIIEKWLKNLEKRSEKKWLSNVTFAISVSKLLCDRIHVFINRPCYIVENGFFVEEYLNLDYSLKKEDYVICYTGQIYDNQQYATFITILNKIIPKFKSRIHVKCIFLGAAFTFKHAKKIKELTRNFEAHYTITERVPKAEVLKIEAGSNILLMMAYGALKGIPSSKLYQYLGHLKPILLFPSDYDVIEEIINTSHCGIIANNEMELEQALIAEIENYLKSENSSTFAEHSKEIMEYSRENQIKKFIDLIKA